MARNEIVVALLLGRKGSVGFPGKNTYLVLGRPLASYPMMAAKNTGNIDKVYLSTDDEKLMAIAEENGVEVIVRPPELCTTEALGEDAYVHGYKEIVRRNEGAEIEQAVLLFCNAATIIPETLEKGISILRENPEYDSAVTVSAYNMWSPLRARKKDENGLLQPFVPFEIFGDPKTLNCDRDSQGDVFFADMSASIVRPKNLLNMDDGMLPQKWMGQKIYPIEQWGGCDIDYEYQLPGVEFWLLKHGFSKDKTPYDK